jgi:hypothetical protein
MTRERTREPNTVQSVHEAIAYARVPDRLDWGRVSAP